MVIANLTAQTASTATLRKDALKRHLKKHNKTTYRQLLSTPKEPLTRIEKEMTRVKEKTRIETKAYQADPTNMNSYIHQQYIPTNKETFPWILHELDIQPRNSRPYYQLDPVIIPLETNELLQDPRET